VSIVVVKNGADGCVVGYDGRVEEVRTAEPADVCDCTLIGSVFNGAFLHAVARGRDPFAAAEFANKVAVVKGRRGGGITGVPRQSDLHG